MASAFGFEAWAVGFGVLVFVGAESAYGRRLRLVTS